MPDPKEQKLLDDYDHYQKAVLKETDEGKRNALAAQRDSAFEALKRYRAKQPILPRIDLSDDDVELVRKLTVNKALPQRIDSHAVNMARAEGRLDNVRTQRQQMADDIKRLALDPKNDHERQRLLGIAEKFESSINAPKSSRAQELRALIRTRKERTSAAATAAENQLRFSQAREGKRSLVAPEDRERFERLLGNRPPKPKEKPKEGPTAGQAAAQVAARHLRTRQIEKASQPAPRRKVRAPRLRELEVTTHKKRIPKSKLPSLVKGKNVKLQVPSGKLPRTQQVRNILNRSR